MSFKSPLIAAWAMGFRQSRTEPSELEILAKEREAAQKTKQITKTTTKKTKAGYVFSEKTA